MILRWYPAVLEPTLGRARHSQTEFAFNVLTAKSGRIFLHHKSGHVSIVILSPNNFHICDRGIADPALAAVQNVVIAIPPRASLHSAGIRSVSVFSERKTADAFTRYEPRQPARMLLRRAERMNRVNSQ